jgi:predicted AAA+ superfamily ATPase
VGRLQLLETEDILRPYNPWWEHGEGGLESLPRFERPILETLIHDINQIPQIIAITGPRRVGKTTLLRQLVRHYLRQNRPAQNLIYYSLDDPALFRPNVHGGKLLDDLMVRLQRRSAGGEMLLMLDEVQRLDRWELYLKKYYDLKYPIRLVISGSASSPIFKKTRESLLGRVKDYHLLPFSFREYLLYQLSSHSTFLEELDRIREQGKSVMGMFAGDPRHIDLQSVSLDPPSEEIWEAARSQFANYVREGGFPEVWSLPTWEQKVDYLYDNQVKKVIYEDLVLAAEFRKPEQLKRFYLSLLERPGREVNLSRVAAETGIILQQIEKYLPLLEMTDLVAHVEKFRKNPIRVRRGSMKFYLVDLALRNAVLRLPDDLTTDPVIMGFYAENLAFNALRKWKGTIALDYYRDSAGEVDFIIHIKPQQYLPVEVKYRDNVQDSDLRGIRSFVRRFRAPVGIVVTKRPSDFGRRDGLFFLPLLHFLLLFD